MKRSRLLTNLLLLTLTPLAAETVARAKAPACPRDTLAAARDSLNGVFSWRRALNAEEAPTFEGNWLRLREKMMGDAPPRRLLIATPSRHGKSTLIRRLVIEWNARPKGLAIFIDLESWLPWSAPAVSPERFADLFFEGVVAADGNRLPAALRERFEYWREQPAFARAVAQADIASLLRQAAKELREAGFNPLLVFDEPMAFNRLGRVRLANPVPDPLPAGVRAKNGDSTYFDYSPLEAVAAQSALPDVWVEPAGVPTRNFGQRLPQLNVSVPVDHFNLEPANRADLVAYLESLTQGAPVHFTPQAIDTLLEQSGGVPLKVRMIVASLPPSAVEITPAHLARAQARARSEMVPLSRGEEAGHIHLGPYPRSAPEGHWLVDWFQFLRPGPKPEKPPADYALGLLQILPPNTSITEEGIEFLRTATGGDLEKTLTILRGLPADATALDPATLAPAVRETEF